MLHKVVSNVSAVVDTEPDCNDQVYAADGVDGEAPEVDEAANIDESEEDDPRNIIPCVRIVVTGTEDPDVTVGTLFLVTCKGGSIGSRGHHEVLLGDKGCSKHHARISYSGAKYYLRDIRVYFPIFLHFIVF